MKLVIGVNNISKSPYTYDHVKLDLTDENIEAFKASSIFLNSQSVDEISIRLKDSQVSFMDLALNLNISFNRDIRNAKLKMLESGSIIFICIDKNTGPVVGKSFMLHDLLNFLKEYPDKENLLIEGFNHEG